MSIRGIRVDGRSLYIHKGSSAVVSSDRYNDAESLGREITRRGDWKTLQVKRNL